MYAAITCQSLMDPMDGLVSYDGATVDGSGNYAFNVLATYRCNTGFVLVGSNTRTCTGDGSSITGDFNGLAPTCEGEWRV